MLTEAQFDIVARQTKQRVGMVLPEDRLLASDARLTPLARREGFACAGELVATAHERNDDTLWDCVADALLNSDTIFFRDREVFRALGERVIPDILRARAAHARLRVWSAGCATGQEPFSFAILMEELKQEGGGAATEIFASDVSARLLDKAAAGLFSQFEVQRGLSARRMITHFERAGEMWRVNDRIRASIRFEPQNLLADARAFGPFDLILCRNVLSTFDAEDRTTALERLATALVDDGVLVLGAEERAEGTDAFQPAIAAGVHPRNSYWRKAA